MKRIFTLLICLTLALPVVIRSAECPDDLKAAEDLMLESARDNDELLGDLNKCIDAHNTCVKALKACEGRCGWVAIAKDRTLQAVLISGAIALIGGVAGIFLVPGGG